MGLLAARVPEAGVLHWDQSGPVRTTDPEVSVVGAAPSSVLVAAAEDGTEEEQVAAATERAESEEPGSGHTQAEGMVTVRTGVEHTEAGCMGAGPAEAGPAEVGLAEAGLGGAAGVLGED